LARKPVQEVLKLDPALGAAKTKEEALAQLQSLFMAAKEDANAYVGERLEEIYELTERAVTLGASYPPPSAEERPRPVRLMASLPKLAARYGSALMLAAMAPLVYADSVLLSIAAGVTAVVTLATGWQRAPRKAPALPRGTQERFRSLASAADQALTSMTAQRALAPPPSEGAGLPSEDMLVFLQEALMLEGSEAADEAARNAERLVARAGYEVVRSPERNEALFEVMRDPGMRGELVLRPALVSRSDRSKVQFGVVVRGGGVG
jgi:hypothetical protein